MKKRSRPGKVALSLGLSTWFGGKQCEMVFLNQAVTSVYYKSERG